MNNYNKLALAPLPAFHFNILFPDLPGLTEADTSFESVSGIQGLLLRNNSSESKSNPNTNIFGPVVLRRATQRPQHSRLLQWIINCLHNQLKMPLHEIIIEVLGEDNTGVLTIILKEVVLKSWSLGELHAGKSNLLMEEIMFDYTAITIQ